MYVLIFDCVQSGIIRFRAHQVSEADKFLFLKMDTWCYGKSSPYMFTSEIPEHGFDERSHMGDLRMYIRQIMYSARERKFLPDCSDLMMYIRRFWKENYKKVAFCQSDIDYVENYLGLRHDEDLRKAQDKVRQAELRLQEAKTDLEKWTKKAAEVMGDLCNPLDFPPPED